MLNCLYRVGLVLALVSALGVSACGRQDNRAGRLSPDSPGVAAENIPILLELGSVTCIPCQKMVPVLERLREEYAGRLRVESYDVKKSPEIGRAYGVMTIPTQVFLNAEGQEVFRHVGYFSYEEVVKILAETGI